MNHLPFIAGSYAAGAIVMAGLVAWIVADGRSLKRRLRDLEARGIRRGSAQPK